MTSPSVTLKAFTDAAADAVAREIASIRREAQREKELRDAEYRARLAELDARVMAVAELERHVAERLAALKDGEPGSPGADGKDAVVDVEALSAIVTAAVETLPPAEPGAPGPPGDPGEPGKDAVLDPELLRSLIGEAVSALPPAEPGPPGSPGRDADTDLVRDLVQEAVNNAIEALPPPPIPKDGRDGHDVDLIRLTQEGSRVEFAFTVDDVCSIFEVELPEGPPGEPGPEGPQGKMRIAKAWADEVHYEGDVTTYRGATYQALRDTGKEPPSEDWLCLAERGQDGEAARELLFLGTWVADFEYSRLNVVALNGASFVAKHDAPGPCPGDGWQLMAAQGKRGAPGERGVPGPKGDRGLPGAPVIAMSCDSEGLLTLVNGDGSEVTCDLYPVLSKLGA